MCHLQLRPWHVPGMHWKRKVFSFCLNVAVIDSRFRSVGNAFQMRDVATENALMPIMHFVLGTNRSPFVDTSLTGLIGLEYQRLAQGHYWCIVASVQATTCTLSILADIGNQCNSSMDGVMWSRSRRSKTVWNSWLTWIQRYPQRHTQTDTHNPVDLLLRLSICVHRTALVLNMSSPTYTVEINALAWRVNTQPATAAAAVAMVTVVPGVFQLMSDVTKLGLQTVDMVDLTLMSCLPVLSLSLVLHWSSIQLILNAHQLLL